MKNVRNAQLEKVLRRGIHSQLISRNIRRKIYIVRRDVCLFWVTAPRPVGFFRRYFV